jgi:Mce-associated membrane protein
VTEGRVDETGAFENDSAATEAEAEDQAPEQRRRRFGVPRVLRSKTLIVAILVVLTLISGGAATWVYFKQYRPDQQTDSGVARTVVSAASDGTVAVMSYSPDTLEKDFAAARSHLTGNFLSYYNQLTQQMMSPTARQKSIKTSAHVMRAAVKELHPDSAVVLVFVDQNTSTKDAPESTMTPSSVLVSMARVNGNWLITEFEPV